jgi:hypothetical protein
VRFGLAASAATSAGAVRGSVHINLVGSSHRHLCSFFFFFFRELFLQCIRSGVKTSHLFRFCVGEKFSPRTFLEFCAVLCLGAQNRNDEAEFTRLHLQSTMNPTTTLTNNNSNIIGASGIEQQRWRREQRVPA